MLTADERALFKSRSQKIDYQKIPQLFFIGNYQRNLPVSVTRMMENAYDWEHLPFVHASSFSSIELHEQGNWGWRAKTELPAANGGGTQILELLVDLPGKYWATAVISGVGEGVQIHTQATEVDADTIEIDLRFYSSETMDEDTRTFMLQYLQDQYRTLYDEDLELMEGRQHALDAIPANEKQNCPSENIFVGDESFLAAGDVHVIETPQGRFCIRPWKDQWIVFAAVCPHRLGPLENSEIDENGDIICPWHGYKFNVDTGVNRDGKCGALGPAPNLLIEDGLAYLTWN